MKVPIVLLTPNSYQFQPLFYLFGLRDGSGSLIEIQACVVQAHCQFAPGVCDARMVTDELQVVLQTHGHMCHNMFVNR